MADEEKKLYRLHAPWYRMGETMPAGTIVRVPESWKSMYWIEVDEAGKPVLPAPKPVPVVPNEDLIVDMPEEAPGMEVQEFDGSLDFPQPKSEAKPETKHGKGKRAADREI